MKLAKRPCMFTHAWAFLFCEGSMPLIARFKTPSVVEEALLIASRTDFTERAPEGEAREDWCTPPEWVAAVKSVFPGGIGLDPVSNPHSLVEAAYNFGLPDYDASMYDWAPYVEANQCSFVNGPYSRSESPRFAQLCADNGQRINVVQLCPARLSEIWFHDIILASNPAAIAFPRGRLKFLQPDLVHGGYTMANAAKFPSCFPMWLTHDAYRNSYIDRFKEVFESMRCAVWIEPSAGNR